MWNEHFIYNFPIFVFRLPKRLVNAFKSVYLSLFHSSHPKLVSVVKMKNEKQSMVKIYYMRCVHLALTITSIHWRYICTNIVKQQKQIEISAVPIVHLTNQPQVISVCIKTWTKSHFYFFCFFIFNNFILIKIESIFYRSIRFEEWNKCQYIEQQYHNHYKWYSHWGQ